VKRTYNSNPFLDDIDVNAEKHGDVFREFLEKKDWRIFITELLTPILLKHNEKFSGWPEKELQRIFEELNPSPRDSPADDTRYFRCGEGNCTHEDECSCYFEATIDAGIPDFPKTHPTQNDRKAYLTFMLNLLSVFLIFLGKYTHVQDLPLGLSILLSQALRWANTDREHHA
jgi:hypothetical protein